MATKKKKKNSFSSKLSAKKMKTTKGGTRKIRESDLVDLESSSPGVPGGFVVGIS